MRSSRERDEDRSLICANVSGHMRTPPTSTLRPPVLIDYLYLLFHNLLPLLLILAVLGIVVGILIAIVRMEQPLLEDTISHWHATLEGVSVSTTDFYDQVQRKIFDWELPDITSKSIYLHEGSTLSCKRLYLRVRRRDLVYDIFVAPFGGGLFVSSWLALPSSTMLKIIAYIPLLGRLLSAIVRGFRPRTYFRVDSAICFQEITHSAVLNVLDELVSLQGATPLSELERKPVMRELYPGQAPRAPQHPAFA